MTNSSEQAATPSFSIEKLYVKDLSVEVPHAPAVFLEREMPQVEIQLRTQAKHLADGNYDVVLTVTVTARIAEKTVFLVELGQAGIFRILNVPEEKIEPIVAINCPGILLPYAREAVSDAVMRAGFAPIVLQPVNFEAMYIANQKQEANASEQTSA